MSMPRSVAPKVTPPDVRQFADDVEYYLSQSPRQLPSRYLYDDLGSALFEAICHLPWYPITEAELALLAAHSREILDRVAPLATLVELGPGSGAKMSALLDAAGADDPVVVHLVDISPAALEAAARVLSLRRGITIVQHQAEYEVGLAQAARASMGNHRAGRTLALFLGSNVGNFDPPGADGLLAILR